MATMRFQRKIPAAKGNYQGSAAPSRVGAPKSRKRGYRQGIDAAPRDLLHHNRDVSILGSCGLVLLTLGLSAYGPLQAPRSPALTAGYWGAPVANITPPAAAGLGRNDGVAIVQ